MLRKTIKKKVNDWGVNPDKFKVKPIVEKIKTRLKEINVSEDVEIKPSIETEDKFNKYNKNKNSQLAG